MATSQNGWPVNPPRSTRTVPGSAVRINVADGPAGDLLLYVASQFDRRVEDIDTARGGVPDDWGHADRPVRGSSTVISNHASATAIDLNATRHPLGVRGTFTDTQVREIHAILREVSPAVRWGGDYSGRVDEMHFEINADAATVAAVAARLRGTAAVAKELEDPMSYEVHLPPTGNAPVERVIAVPAQHGATAITAVYAAIVNANSDLRLHVAHWQVGNPTDHHPEEMVPGDTVIPPLSTTGGQKAPAGAYSLVIDYETELGASVVIEAVR